MGESAEQLDGGWQAELYLQIAARGEDRSVLARRSHSGPLGIQRAFYPEGGVPHLYLLHPPGGVVGGDQLRIEVEVERGAHALITTPAAGKFYRCEGRQALMSQQLVVQEDACLEWLPQETIIYEGADAQSHTRVELSHSSRFIGWEMLCLGRPAAKEGFERGQLRQRLEVWREGRPLWLERACFEGGSEALAAPWGLAGYPLSATLVAVGCPPGLAADIREQLPCTDEERLSVTQMNDVLVCRYLGWQAQHARQRLAAVWALLRPQLAGRPACEPRVWHT